jgi:ATP-dependent RNA helicase HelY
MNARPPEIPPHKLISALRGYDLLPAIIFLPTRRKCDEAASEVAGDRSQKTDPERQKRREAIFLEFAAENPEITRHKHQKILVNSGVASHHAGHIPAWKLLVEKMMSAGLLNAIFATSTVAAGVDFPARTVVVTNADTRGNEGWRPLQASELQQMTGRAGRRGKDNVGFVVLVPGQFQNPKKIAELLKSKPDPLESRFRATYTSLLNLLDAFGNFEQVREIAQKSYAYQEMAREIEKLKKEREERRRRLAEKLDGNKFGLSEADVRGFERLTSAKNRLEEKLPVTRAEIRQNWLRENVQSGRIVTQGRSGKRLFLVFNVFGEKVSAMRDDGQGTTFALARVNRVYKNIYSTRSKNVEEAFLETFAGKNKPLDEPKPAFKKHGSDDAAALLNNLVANLGQSADGNPQSASSPPAGGGVAEAWRGRGGGRDPQSEQLLWECYDDAERIERYTRDINVLQSEIWLPFERRAKVLDHFGYLDFGAEKVTDTGKWLADVRVDRPLLVGEAIRRGIFDNLTPQTAAGLMASLAADSDRNYGDLYLSDALLDVISRLEEVIFDVSNVEWNVGIEPAEEINLSAAAAAERWASGLSWDQLAKKTGAEEGDLFRLLARTGEALLQIANLRDSNANAAAIARTTAEIILREPVR